MTDANASYALEISHAAVAADGGAFFIRVYSPGGVLVFEEEQTTTVVDALDCGGLYPKDFDAT